VEFALCERLLFRDHVSTLRHSSQNAMHRVSGIWAEPAYSPDDWPVRKFSILTGYHPTCASCSTLRTIVPILRFLRADKRTALLTVVRVTYTRITLTLVWYFCACATTTTVHNSYLTPTIYDGTTFSVADTLPHY